MATPQQILEPMQTTDLDAEVASLEQVWNLPAVEPQRRARTRRRRATVVVHAASIGYSPIELMTVLLFAVMTLGFASLVAIQLFA